MATILNYIRSAGPILILSLLGYLINPFDWGYLFGYLLFAMVIVKKDFVSQNLDFNLLLITLFSVIYGLFYSFQADALAGRQYIAIYAITPPVFYLLGKYLVKDNVTAQGIFYLLITITGFFSLSALFSVFLNFLEGGFVQLDRNIPSFWTGNKVSATLMASFFSLNMCIPGLLLADLTKKHLVVKIITVTLFVLSLICVLRLGSRTQLGIFLITTFLSLLYIFPKQSGRRNFLLFLVVVGIIGYILTHVSFDTNADWASTFADRMDGNNSSIASGGGRTERWTKSINYLFSHPLGWSVQDFGFSHNLWFDVARVAGIIPFIILIIFSVRAFYNIKSTASLNRDNIILNNQLRLYGVAFFLIFMVEPILDGMFSLFAVFCLFLGLVNKYRSNEKLDFKET